MGSIELKVRVCSGDGSRYPRLAILMDEAEGDVLTYLVFPREHWCQVWSNNLIEWLNREVKQ